VTRDSDLERVERAIGELLRLSGSRRVHQVRMRQTGLTLTRTDLRFLHRIDEHGRRSVSALAEELDVSQPTASRTLKRLEDDGLVARRVSESDGRVANYEITPAGRRARARVLDVAHEQLASSLADWSARRRRDLADRLDELVAALHGHN
jgi:MarR family transcriptional regulator for hemolysin